MKSMKTVLTLALLMAVLTSFSFGQEFPDGGGALPNDPMVRTGQLKNGMKYYIRKNAEPANRAELRLVVNAGSMQENDDQQGLAHFCEHMCFNGSKNFKKNELVDYLESIGTKFGAHLNAYTSFDETVYMLQVPTDDAEILEKSFLVLEDWAHNVSFDNEEIDKERGVVIEEWRLGQGAQERMREKYFPVLFYNSRYANRLPIGKKDILENFEYQKIKDFYQDWYRPDLMSVVAVGDFDLDEIEQKIKDQFSGIEPTKSPRTKEDNAVPMHKDTKVVVATDKEAPMTLLQIMYKKPYETVSTQEDYYKSLQKNLYQQMLSARLMELTQQAEPPFAQAFVFGGSFVRGSSFFMAGALLDPNKIEDGTIAVTQEAERARRHGFVESELERAKRSMMSEMETAYKDRNKTPSRNLVNEYVSAALEDEAFPGIEWEHKFYQDYLSQITVEDINAVAQKAVTEENVVIVVMAPEGADVPDEAALLKAYQGALKGDIEPYEDKVSDAPLVAKEPTPGKVIDTKKVDELGVIEWTLANGAKVVIKPTDFRNDEILFYASSPGGTSRASDSKYFSAAQSADVMAMSGVGSFDQTTLDKKLTGVNVEVYPWLDEMMEGYQGSATPDDLETMLQLVYLYSTSPRMDKDALSGFQSQMRAQFQTMNASPRKAFSDTVQVTLANYHKRRPVYTEEIWDDIKLLDAYMFYFDRFSDVSDFTFYFVGNIDLERDKPLIEKYLGGINGASRQETWKDHEINPPKGAIEKTVYKGVEPQSMVSMTFHGDMKNWSNQEIINMNAMGKVLNIMMRESMREEKGGVYGVSGYPSFKRFPEPHYTYSVFFGCAPDNVEDLINTAISEIRTLKKEGPSEKNMTKVMETLRRERETNLRENKFWMQILSTYYERGQDPTDIMKFDTYLRGVSADAIQKAANQYFDMDNYVQVVLKPVE